MQLEGLNDAANPAVIDAALELGRRCPCARVLRELNTEYKPPDTGRGHG